MLAGNNYCIRNHCGYNCMPPYNRPPYHCMCDHCGCNNRALECRTSECLVLECRALDRCVFNSPIAYATTLYPDCIRNYPIAYATMHRGAWSCTGVHKDSFEKLSPRGWFPGRFTIEWVSYRRAHRARRGSLTTEEEALGDSLLRLGGPTDQTTNTKPNTLERIRQ